MSFTCVVTRHVPEHVVSPVHPHEEYMSLRAVPSRSLAGVLTLSGQSLHATSTNALSAVTKLSFTLETTEREFLAIAAGCPINRLAHIFCPIETATAR